MRQLFNGKTVRRGEAPRDGRPALDVDRMGVVVLGDDEATRVTGGYIILTGGTRRRYCFW